MLDKYIISLSILIILSSFSEIQSQPTVLFESVAFTKAMFEFGQGLNEIEDLKKIVSDIENKRDVHITSNPYSDLADKIKKMADDVSKESVLPDFDASKFAITPDELKDCKNYNKLNMTLLNLSIGLNQLQNDTFLMRMYLTQVDSSISSVNYLKDVHKKLIDVPIYGKIFEWDWFVLETDLSNAFAKLKSAFKERMNKANTILPSLSIKVDNLKSNMALLKSYNCFKNINFTSGATNSELKTGTILNIRADAVDKDNNTLISEYYNWDWQIENGVISYVLGNEVTVKIGNHRGKCKITVKEKLTNIKKELDIYAFDEQSFLVDAKNPINTGIYMNYGDKYSVTASGSWCWGGGNDCCDGNGTPGRPNSEERPTTVSNCFMGTLIGKISDADYFRLGTNFTGVSFANGYLLLWMNDRIGNYGDNSGYLNVSIKLYGK